MNDKALKFRTNFGADINFIHNKAFGVNFGDDDGGGAARIEARETESSQ
ncbi:hypothetical protein [Salegentibacter salegens]|nr:hypothetical protein [Salegentibacter salegens]